MNFLIAILSYTYEKMEHISEFKYKVNLYEYQEKYLIAFEEDQYSHLILHSAPLNLLSMALLPLFLIRPLAKPLNTMLSYFHFWLENLALIKLFLAYELLISPLVYLKTLWNLLTGNPKHLFTSLCFTFT